MADRRLSRRAFLGAGAAGAALLLGNQLPVWVGERTRLPHRPVGKTGVRVPILGLGTVAVGSLSDAKAAAALINRALDLWVTFIDTAPARTSVAPITGYFRAQRYLNG